ncbi:2Fe-2S iron-sulfur cluster binding domain-containing protein [Xylophilus rhododendri]|uniref:2Fe-2S iron-sulfur cluster binding domain-containing protein n=2 Tax=Xylophilus rhododendri TaxID=2697032 RepID=A0A857JEK0_9BURK|nr:2Fe-2S iron-sulfur cluster binding domain-containing protein [Xylophilus rhododendri]
MAAASLSTTVSTTLAVTVAARALLPGGVLHLRLRSADGAPLPAFEPGAHVDLHLGDGLVRQYSLCGDPDLPGDWQLAILLARPSRGGSQAVHDRLAPGSRWTVSPPRNQFPLAAGTRRAVLLAGGIGITPLLAMAWRLHRLGTPFTLHYAVRGQDSAAFAGLLQDTPFADRVHLHADDGPAAQQLDILQALGEPQPGTHAYTCGPEGFMRAVQAGARALGWPADHCHQEHFQPPDEEVQPADRAFTVQAARSGVTVQVPVGCSISSVLLKAGVTVWTSCEQGVCGTCLTPLLAGEADHRDRYQTAEEKAAQNQVALCCSRALSPTLVLDL